MNCTIIIADDHPIFRSGTRAIVDAIPGAHVVAEAGDGLEAYRQVLAHRPDIAILDLEMPVLTGLEVCRKLLAEKHSTRLIVLTMHKDRHFFDDAISAGVRGYLLKDNATAELVKCIDAVQAGQRYISPGIQNYLTEHTAATMPPDIAALYATLTPTEKVILKLVAGGSTSQQIAASIFISPNTVENHRASIARKLRLEGKNSLMKFALLYPGML